MYNFTLVVLNETVVYVVACRSSLLLHSFDFIHDDGKRVEANGFRSLLYILNCCMLKLRKYLARNRTGVFYIPGDDLSSITAYTRALEVQ